MNNELTKAIELAATTVEDLTKSMEPGGSTITEELRKSHVKAYTRQDGTAVQEHEDKRQKLLTMQKHANDLSAKTYGNQTAEGHAKAAKAHSDFANELNDYHKQPGSYFRNADAELNQHQMAATYHKDKADKLTNAHAKAKDKDAPPQADSNRDKWDDLPDDEHPREAMKRIGSAEIGKIANGKTDVRQRAKEELAARGVDEHGKWLGFDKAAKHHGTEGAKQKDDEIDGHFQTVHHKVLGAIASGHTDPKRLASEELANRGHDHDGKWIGFDKAAKLHGTDK